MSFLELKLTFSLGLACMAFYLVLVRDRTTLDSSQEYILQRFPLHHSFFQTLAKDTREPFRKDSVLIIQADTRPIPTHLPNFPHLNNSQLTNISNPTLLSPVLNRMYACRHGYDYKYIQFIPPDNNTFTKGKGNERKFYENPIHHICRHEPSQSARVPAWCKIVALAYGFSLGYEYVLYLDTDALIVRQAQTIQKFMDMKHEYLSERDDVKNATLIVTQDWNSEIFAKYSSFCQAGVLLMKNTENTMPMLKYWWNALPDSKWNRRFDAEQHVLSNVVFGNEQFRSQIARVRDREINSPFGSWIRHFSGKRFASFQNQYEGLAKRIPKLYDNECSLDVTQQLNASEISLSLLNQDLSHLNLSDIDFP